MEDKLLLQSLDKFYEKNHIDPSCYTAAPMTAYQENKYLDAKISEDELKEKLFYWSKNFKEDDRQLFLSLFEKYDYISERELEYRLFLLCSFIFNKMELEGIKREEVLFVTVPSENGTGGGGDSIRNHLLTVNMEWGIEKEQIISDISKVNESLLRKRKAIIFMDDIIGTGFTIRGTIDEFLKRFPCILEDAYLWGVSAVLVTSNAIKYLKKKFKSTRLNLKIYVDEENYIKSCMKGNYIFKENEIKEIEKIVRQYEEQIGMNLDSGKNFAMGFRECKLLVSFYYNTPNNTLCSFWKYTEDHIPIFPRDEYMRPTLEELKKRRKHNIKNAYLKGCIE